MRLPSGENEPRAAMCSGTSCDGPPPAGTSHRCVYETGAEPRPDAYRISLPSGVQPRASAPPPGYHVRRRGSPPSAGTTQTWSEPVRFDVNAIIVPSGEKWGPVSIAGVAVRRRASPP